MLCLWCVCLGNDQISAITAARKTIASPCLMKSDFATAHLSRGGCNEHANFSPPVARCPDPWPWPWPNNPAVRLWFVRPTFAGALAEFHAMGPRPLASQPFPSRLSNQPLLSQPTCRDPSISVPLHPIQVATPSIVKTCSSKREPCDDQPGTPAGLGNATKSALNILAVDPSYFGLHSGPCYDTWCYYSWQ
ncbi:hypothetical protein GGI43DRAFT_98166 [Trichoderma evansii]